MSSDNREIAAAFSGHRFRETYDHLAPNIVWVAAGGSTTEGKDDVISACEETLAELENTTTEFTRFLTVADDDVAAVDVIGRYTDLAGRISTVASCDIYEFRDNLVTRITSYTVEIPRQHQTAQPEQRNRHPADPTCRVPAAPVDPGGRPRQ